MAWVQFTAFIRVTVGAEDNPRIANIRDLQYAAYSINQALSDEETINLSKPATTTSLGKFGNIGQIVPALGDNPALVKITGYHDYAVSGDLQPSQTLIHSNSAVSRSGPSHLWDSDPNTSYKAGMAALKEIMDTNIPNFLSDEYEYEVYRLNYAGVVYGNKGLTF